jgi:C4-dicarboxylate transporter, DctM subunit
MKKLPVGTRVVWLAILVCAVLLSVTGQASPTELADELGGGGGSSSVPGGLLLVAALAAMVVLGSPLFVIIGVLAAMCFAIYGDGYALKPCLTLSSEGTCGFDIFPAKMADLTTKNVLLAIPFFVVSGAIMSAGDIANRLVAFARALVGFLPGGLAIATVGGCIFFAAISGSSPVTVIAIGSMMYPALVKAGYQERFSMGLVTTAGSLGILIPPSIPMLVFAIVAGSTAPVDVGELFMAGIVPGVMIGALLSIYSVFVQGGSSTEARTKISAHGVWTAFREGFWAVMLPVLILGGIYSGLFTPTEAAAVSVVYALVVELFIHRTITIHHLPKVLADSAVMLGTLLIIMALALGLNDFLVEEKIPDLAVAKIQAMDLSPIQFLLIINVLLLVVGAVMDSISAIMVIAPLLAPIAIQLGIDPVHLGVVFIVNLEIGYLTPPIGINLFVASAAFGKAMGEVMRSVIPFIVLMFVGLAIVTYVPTVSMGPVNVFLRDKPFYEPLPDGVPKVAGGVGDVRTSADISRITEQVNDMCNIAEDVLDDEVPMDARVKAWRDGFEGEEIDIPELLDVADRAVAIAPSTEAYALVQKEAAAMLGFDWECEELEKILVGQQADEDDDEDDDEGFALPIDGAGDEDEDEDEDDDEGFALPVDGAGDGDEDEDEDDDEGFALPIDGFGDDGGDGDDED